MPRHRPASLRRIVPVLVLLGFVAGALLVSGLRPPAPTPGKPKATSATRASAAGEPRKQRARPERPAAPVMKSVKRADRPDSVNLPPPKERQA
jgi:hypothetical protein